MKDVAREGIGNIVELDASYRQPAGLWTIVDIEATERTLTATNPPAVDSMVLSTSKLGQRMTMRMVLETRHKFFRKFGLPYNC